MKFIPRTLLGRTALYLGALMFIGQILWFGSTGYFLLRPIKDTYIEQIGAMITMAQALVEKEPDAANLTANDTPAFAPSETYKIMRTTGPHIEFAGENDGLIDELGETLRKRVDVSILVRTQKDQPILWIRFPVGEKTYWLVMPIKRPLPHYSMLFWVGIVITISVGGAYLIIFSLTQQLRKVTAAARAVGQGELPGPLAETGPQEVRDLSAGFNQMAADLRKLDADRRLMLAGISHDLRTPLTHLRIAVELAAVNAEPALAAGMVGDIEDMDSILMQFLDYARDGSEEKPEPGDLNAIIRDVGSRYQSRGKALKMTLGVIPLFTFRPRAMRRVITNLVDNAVRYGREDVCVETRSDGSTLTVIVTDRGPGIRNGRPSDYIKPFAREDAARSEPGAGLGLAIVDRVIRLHGGNLQMENRPAGGLQMMIELPFTPLHGEQAAGS